MPVKKLAYNPVRAPRGTRTHGATYGVAPSPTLKTACGLAITGWVVCLTDELDCEECKRVIANGGRRRRRAP